MSTAAGTKPLSTSLRELSSEECMAALQSHTLGRIALSVDALPVIFPVNYIFDRGGLLFRTGSGSALDRSSRNTVVAFEVDDFDQEARAGWSVLVVGVASVQYGGDWLRALELGLSSVGAADGAVFVKIVPGTITGRVIETAADSVSAQS